MKVLNDGTFNIQTFTEQESKKFQTKIHSKAAEPTDRSRGT